MVFRAAFGLFWCGALIVLGWNWRELWDSEVIPYKIVLKPKTYTEVSYEPPAVSRTVSKSVKGSTQHNNVQGLPGNTDGGHLPWNGGDLWMNDYSGLTHPSDGLTRP